MTDRLTFCEHANENPNNCLCPRSCICRQTMCASKPYDPVQQLFELLQEARLTLKFGLRQQGKVPKVVEMIAAGQDWKSIGHAIGWTGDAARDWFVRFELKELLAELLQLRAAAQRQPADARLIMARLIDMAESRTPSSRKHHPECWRIHDACALRRASDVISELLPPAGGSELADGEKSS